MGDLLEMILLVSDLEDLRADPQGELDVVVIETRQDRRKGPLATLLVKNGTLKVGSKMTLGNQTITIKALTDADGKPVETAGPATPVEVLGWKKLPGVGQTIRGEEKKLEIVKTEKEQPKQALTNKEAKEDETAEGEEQKEKQTVNVILKTDIAGTLEAITTNLSEEVEIVGSGTGEVNE